MAAPCHALFCVCAITAVVILGIAGCFLVVGVAPVFPSCWHDVAAKGAVHEQSVSIRAPRTTKINLSHPLVGNKAAAVEDLTILCIGRC